MFGALRSILQPSPREKRGRFGAYIPLTSSEPGGGSDREYHHHQLTTSQSIWAFCCRVPSIRTLLILTFLLSELFIGYAIAWWQFSSAVPISRDGTVSKSEPIRPGLDAPSPVATNSQRPITVNDAGDFFYSPPIGNDHLPPVPPYNILTNLEALHTLEELQSPATPLFIPFTRNHKMLYQTILSYIAAGWPRSQIIVLENTGTMDANVNGKLTPQNAFYLDYELLRKRYGVSVLRTPTHLSFAQLQNFMVATAMSKGWKWYFWGHQDVAVLSDEDVEEKRFLSFYERAVNSLANLTKTMGEDAKAERWAAMFYNFDWLALVNVGAIVNVGPWDTFIPFYNTDCDWYERARMAGLKVEEERIGLIFDLDSHISNPETKFFGYTDNGGQSDIQGSSVNSTRFQTTRAELQQIHNKKSEPEYDRNTWQKEQKGGKGEAWTYNPDGFQKAWWKIAEAGREIFERKWGTGECAIFSKENRTTGDMWNWRPPAKVPQMGPPHR